MFFYISVVIQYVFNINSTLFRTKQQQQVEPLNRKIFRVIHSWHDATNDAVINLPAYKSIEILTKTYFTKLFSTIISSY